MAITLDVASDRGTAALGRQLQAAGVQGTFFTSGRALASASTVDRQLMSEGHLLGSRSSCRRAFSTASARVRPTIRCFSVRPMKRAAARPI